MIPFKKGDPRINRNGRPRTFDQCRELAQKIAHEDVTLKDGKKLPVIEAVLRKLAAGDTRAKEIFLQYAFGKVPDKLETTLEHKTKLYLNYAHEERHAGEDRSRISPAISSRTN